MAKFGQEYGRIDGGAWLHVGPRADKAQRSGANKIVPGHGDAGGSRGETRWDTMYVAVGTVYIGLLWASGARLAMLRDDGRELGDSGIFPVVN